MSSNSRSQRAIQLSRGTRSPNCGAAGCSAPRICASSRSDCSPPTGAGANSPALSISPTSPGCDVLGSLTEDLLTALYRARIAAHEHAVDVAGAITATAAIVEELPGLFAGRGPLRSADVLKMFALRHSLPGAADAIRVRELIDEPGLNATERRWLSAIAESLAAPPAPRQTAHDALLAGDLDGALALAQAEPPGERRPTC